MHDIDAGELADIYHADLPTPTGATQVEPWMEWADGTWLRGYTIEILRDGRLTVEIGGYQQTNGDYTHNIDVAPVDALTTDEARTLAAMLTTAATKVDALTQDAV